MTDLATRVSKEKQKTLCTFLMDFARMHGGNFAPNNGGFTLYFKQEIIEEIKARLEGLLTQEYGPGFTVSYGAGKFSQGGTHISINRDLPCCPCSNYSRPCFTVAPSQAS